MPRESNLAIITSFSGGPVSLSEMTVHVKSQVAEGMIGSFSEKNCVYKCSSIMIPRLTSRAGTRALPVSTLMVSGLRSVL